MPVQLHFPQKYSVLLFLFSSCFSRFLVVDEVWKQQTLLQLLQIVELPVLDCILVSPGRVQLQACRTSLANQDLVISNTCLERELPNTLNLPQSVHVKHFCLGFDPCCVSSMHFNVHHYTI